MVTLLSSPVIITTQRPRVLHSRHRNIEKTFKDENTNSELMSTFHSRPTKNPAGIPSPIWPKYVGDDGSSGKNVQIMKERFAQQKLCDDSVSSASDGHQNIVTWLQGISLRRDTIEIMITDIIASLLTLLHILNHYFPHDHEVSAVRPERLSVTRSREMRVTRSVRVTTSTSCPGPCHMGPVSRPSPCHVTRVTLSAS